MRIRFDPRWAFILLVGGAAACATGRQSLGDIKVTASPPQLTTQVIRTFDFHVEEGRISMTDPGNPSAFDFTEGADGCLRGNANNVRNLKQICRVPSDPSDPAGSSRWKSTSSTLTFTAQLSADQNSVVVQSGVSRGQFLLGQGPAAEELRKRPELLGAAFAYGYVPRAGASESSQDNTRDYTFVVGSGA
jgi:hypothetical protein